MLVLAIFVLAGSSLLTLSPLFLPCLILVVTSVTLGLVLLTFHTSDPQLRLPSGSLRPLLGVSLVLPVGSLLLMLFFFVVLPRTQYPLWQFLNPASTAQSGFSDKVRPVPLLATPALMRRYSVLKPKRLGLRTFTGGASCSM
ncbi:MAG: transglutaminaseTgpA domain-containing protein [Syntrophotaleaceae bacterium]